jgi:hypothetical protein
MLLARCPLSDPGEKSDLTESSMPTLRKSSMRFPSPGIDYALGIYQLRSYPVNLKPTRHVVSLGLDIAVALLNGRSVNELWLCIGIPSEICVTMPNFLSCALRIPCRRRSKLCEKVSFPQFALCPRTFAPLVTRKLYYDGFHDHF